MLYLRIVSLFASLSIAAHSLEGLTARPAYRPQRLFQPSPNKITNNVVPLTRSNSASISSNLLRSMRTGRSTSRSPSRLPSDNSTLTSVEDGAVFLAPLIAGGRSYQVVIDTGSSDTWLVSPDFTCADPSSGDAIPQEDCEFARYYTPSSTFSQIPDVNFNISYADDEVCAGIMGYENLTFAGIQVSQQEMAVVDYAAWYGDGYSSGLVGLAYSLLTNQYPGSDPQADMPETNTPYSPITTTIFSDNLTAPMFSLALFRAPADSESYVANGGYLALGGIPDIPHDPFFLSTPIDIVGINTVTNQPVYEFYTITVGGWAIANDTSTQFNPFPTRNTLKRPVIGNGTQVIVDSGTSLVYVPDDVAAVAAGLFNPPAYYNQTYGLYIVDCDAIPPTFGVDINDKIFYVNPEDLIIPGPDTLCSTGIQPDLGSFSILGDVFLRNVIAVFDVGAAEMRFAAREFTGT